MRIVSSEYLQSNNIPWCFRVDSPKFAATGKAFVINLDDKGEQGTHWTAARVIDNILYYADPFGTVMNGWPPEELAKYKKQIISRIAFQRPKSYFCGYYSMLFCRAMDTIVNPISLRKFEEILFKAIS